MAEFWLRRGLFFVVAASGCLLACWAWGDMRLRTKWIFTALYAASWGLLFLPGYEPLFVLAQCLLVILIGGATFGLDWLVQR